MLWQNRKDILCKYSACFSYVILSDLKTFFRQIPPRADATVTRYYSSLSLKSLCLKRKTVLSVTHALRTSVKTDSLLTLFSVPSFHSTLKAKPNEIKLTKNKSVTFTHFFRIISLAVSSFYHRSSISLQ